MKTTILIVSIISLTLMLLLIILQYTIYHNQPNPTLTTNIDQQPNNTQPQQPITNTYIQQYNNQQNQSLQSILSDNQLLDINYPSLGTQLIISERLFSDYQHNIDHQQINRQIMHDDIEYHFKSIPMFISYQYFQQIHIKGFILVISRSVANYVNKFYVGGIVDHQHDITNTLNGLEHFLQNKSDQLLGLYYVWDYWKIWMDNDKVAFIFQCPQCLHPYSRIYVRMQCKSKNTPCSFIRFGTLVHKNT